MRKEEERKRRADEDRRKQEEIARQNSSRNRDGNRPGSSSRRESVNSRQSGGSSQRGNNNNKPKNPINVNVNNALDKKEKLRNIDEKIELLQREREEARRINDEKKKKREEDRKQFLTDIKNKSLKKNNNDVEVYWSEKNALNKFPTDELPTDSQPTESTNYIVSKPSSVDNPSDDYPYPYEDEEYNPCGINENQVNSDDMKAMNECMMNIYLDDEQQEGLNDNEEADGDEEEQLDQDMLNKINLSSANDNTDNNNFNGDIQQFFTFLEERLGSTTLAKVKELIKK